MHDIDFEKPTAFESDDEHQDIDRFEESGLLVDSTAVMVLTELRRRDKERRDDHKTPILPNLECKWVERKGETRVNAKGDVVPVLSGLRLKFNAPWRADSDSLSCELHLDNVSGEGGTYTDHADTDYEPDKEAGNGFTAWTLYDLAFRLGIKPRPSPISHRDEPHHVAYTGEQYAEFPGVPWEYLQRTCKVEQVNHFDPRVKTERLALRSPTPSGKFRYRFLGDNKGKSKFAHDKDHGIVLYGLQRAIRIAHQEGLD